MAQQVYPPNVIVKVIGDAFFRHRGLALAPRGLARDAEPPNFDDDRVIGDIEQFNYVRLDAVRAAPRGARDWVVIFVLGADGKYSHHSPDLRRLLEGVEAERPAKEGRLDEVIVVAEEAFFSKKNLTDVVREAQLKQAGGPDPAGGAPFYNAYPYDNFALVVPEHASVYPHRVMGPAEVEGFLDRERLTRADLPVIYTTDAPIVWNGGREGQVVEITRDSQTAGRALYYRRVERAGI
jgi:DNA-directed RNA polymerase subunit H (RpoH/RPB5)